MDKKNDIEMHSTHNEGKSVIAERHTRTLKNKILKHMTSISKYVYIDKLDYIVNKYNNKYHITIKMKPIDVKSNTYIDSSKEVNDKDPKFKTGDIVRILKHNAKGYVQNWSEEVFVIKTVKNITVLNGEEIFGTFCKKELQKKKKKKKSKRV